MKILQINKFHFVQGGADAHYLDLCELLESKGHEVIHFSMRHEKNAESPYTRYFIENVSTAKKFNWNGLKTALKYLYNFESAKKLEKLIKEHRPDIAHIHNIYHQLSPSILVTLKKYKIPVVMTIHDHKLISPNYGLYAHNRICEHSFKYKYWNTVRYRCVKNSYAASIVCALESSLHKLFGLYEKNIDLAIAPSEYMSNQFKRYGSKLKEIIAMPYFMDVQFWKSAEKSLHSDPYFVFYGRLSGEKGVSRLLEAWKAKKQNNARLIIIGDGPEEAHLKELSQKYGLQNVIFTGKLARDQIQEYLKNAIATIVPSQYYDNYPLVVIESLATQTPVIGSDLGGIPELVKNKKTGMIFHFSDTKQLSECIDYIATHQEEAIRWGKNGRKLIESTCDPKKFYNELMQIYSKLITQDK